MKELARARGIDREMEGRLKYLKDGMKDGMKERKS